MKVWELMAILAKCPAGADVWGLQSPHEYRSEVSRAYLEDDSEEPFVCIDFAETVDNE